MLRLEFILYVIRNISMINDVSMTSNYDVKRKAFCIKHCLHTFCSAMNVREPMLYRKENIFNGNAHLSVHHPLQQCFYMFHYEYH